MLHFTRARVLEALLAAGAVAALASWSLAPVGAQQAPDAPDAIRFSHNTMVDFSALGGEPFIRVDAFDRIFVSAPFGLSTTVSLLWKSVDGGRSFIPLGTPVVRDAVTGPGGGDTHQDFDDQQWLYYVDLSGACVTAAVSTDGGNTFPPERINPLACASAQTPQGATDDRQWVAGFGQGIGYVTFRNLLGSGFYLFKTRNGGLSWDQGRQIGTVSQSGPLQIDKKKRRVFVNGAWRDAILVYQIYYSGTNLRLFRITDLDDGSPLVIDSLSIVNPGVSIANVFPVLSVGRDGSLYAVWSQQARTIFMATSRDRGQTWSAPIKVSHNDTGSNIMPWVAAGDAGRVDVIWYGSNNLNPSAPAGAWNLYMAQSIDAFAAAPSFSHTRINETTIKYGEICLAGLTCDLDGRDRGFLEFPSIDVDSKGMAVVTYNDNTNQVQATHVWVARQITGPSVYASIGTVELDPGTVEVTSPAGNETVLTPTVTVAGTHTLPPASFDNDEALDAYFPDQGRVAGNNIPALDLRQVSVSDDGANLNVTLEVADLTTTALATAAAQGGGDGVLYLAQWEFGDRLHWVGAEVRGATPIFYTGDIAIIRSATSKKFMTYNPDLVKSQQVTGQIVNAAPGTITLRLPRALAAGAQGAPANGAALASVTGFAFTERGPLVPLGSSDPAFNPTSLPIKVDATGPFTYTVGQGPQFDGVVEVSIDDASFASPRTATLANPLDDSSWSLSIDRTTLSGGPHTAYVRQRANGRRASEVASVEFNVPAATEQPVDGFVSLESSNLSFGNGATTFNLAIRNTSAQRLLTPMRVQVAGLSSASGAVTVANADNAQPGPGALWSYTENVGSDYVLSPAEASGARTLRFNNPSSEGFTLTLSAVAYVESGGGTSMTSGGETTSGGGAGSATSGTSSGSGQLFQLSFNPVLKTLRITSVTSALK